MGWKTVIFLSYFYSSSTSTLKNHIILLLVKFSNVPGTSLLLKLKLMCLKLKQQLKQEIAECIMLEDKYRTIPQVLYVVTCTSMNTIISLGNYSSLGVAPLSATGCFICFLWTFILLSVV